MEAFFVAVKKKLWTVPGLCYLVAEPLLGMGRPWDSQRYMGQSSHHQQTVELLLNSQPPSKAVFGHLLRSMTFQER